MTRRPGVPAAVGERDRVPPRAAPELQHVGAGGDPRERLAEEPSTGARIGLVGRRPVRVADGVVPLADDPPRVAHAEISRSARFAAATTSSGPNSWVAHRLWSNTRRW